MPVGLKQGWRRRGKGVNETLAAANTTPKVNTEPLAACRHASRRAGVLTPECRIRCVQRQLCLVRLFESCRHHALSIPKYRDDGIVGGSMLCRTTSKDRGPAGVRRVKALEQAQARQLLLTLAFSLGERTCVRPLKWSIDVCAQMLGLPVERVHGPHVGSMSGGWLREHEAESEKHSAGH
jgi:hypothetical protein